MFFKKSADDLISSITKEMVTNVLHHEKQAELLQQTINENIAQLDYHRAEADKLSLAISAIVNRSAQVPMITDAELESALIGFDPDEKTEPIAPNSVFGPLDFSKINVVNSNFGDITLVHDEQFERDYMKEMDK